MSGSRSRSALLADLAVFAAGVAAGSLLEEYAYRRVFRTDDPAAGEPFGTIRGTRVDVTAHDGTILAAESFGPEDSTAVVLAHGITESRDIWHYQIRELSTRFRVVAYDARGHGESGAARGPEGKTDFSMPVLAGDLRAVLEAAGVERAVLVGHSLGGMTVLQYCADHVEEIGERIGALALVNTSFTSALGMWAAPGAAVPVAAGALVRRLSDWLVAKPRRSGLLRVPRNDLTMFAVRTAFGPGASPRQVAFLRDVIAATPPATAAAAGGLVDYDVHAALGDIAIPVTIIGGSRDFVTPPSLSVEMSRRIDGARLVVLPGVGHQSMLERHAEVGGEIAVLAERALAGSP